MKIILRLLLTLSLIILLSLSIFAQSERKAAYGILIDNTGTLWNQFDNVQLLGKAIVQNVGQRGTISLFNFETQGTEKKPLAVVRSGTEWSQDKALLEKYIDKVKIVRGQTVLFDAIRSIATVTDAKANAEKFLEKIVILITDGEDRASEVKEEQLIKELRESGVKVYAIGIIQDLGDDGGFIGRSPQEKAKKFLKKITTETGGNVIFPKFKKDTRVEDLLTELFAEPSKK